MRIVKEKCAAIVVDYQEKLVPVIRKNEELIENTQKLLKGLVVLEVPMVMTQQYTKGLGMTVSEIREACGTDKYAEKIAFSSYGEQAVQQMLGDDKEYVIVCGIEAHICVLQTVLDIKADGKIPVLVIDCISSRKKSDKKIAVKRAISEGAIVTTYESLLFELLKEAGTPTSKAIQKLIK